MKHIVFTVTNDLTLDRRMHRICTSLATNGYLVTLVGVRNRRSLPPGKRIFRQERFYTFFRRGPWFYAEYNIRLFFMLLFKKFDAICCIDMDTMPAGFIIGKLRRKLLVYDAHEFFSEMKEVVSRRRVHQFWHWLERLMIPRIKNGYTVSDSIANEFERLFGVKYETIRNVPFLKERSGAEITDNIVLYQGSVNEARGLESLVPAMKSVNGKLLIYGEGNIYDEIKGIIAREGLAEKVILHGSVPPEELEKITGNARIGINTVENCGRNQYFSLANKFFDYIMNGLPQVTMNFPEYAAINKKYEVAVLIDNTSADEIAGAINRLVEDKELYNRLRANCAVAASDLNWENEEKKLIEFYKRIL